MYYQSLKNVRQNKGYERSIIFFLIRIFKETVKLLYGLVGPNNTAEIIKNNFPLSVHSIKSCKTKTLCFL